MAIGRRAGVARIRGPCRPLLELQDKERERRENLDDAVVFEHLEGGRGVGLAGADLAQDLALPGDDEAPSVRVRFEARQEALGHAFATLPASPSFGKVA